MENIQKFRKKGKKLGEYMMTKLRLLRDQKKYRSRGVTLKYMLDRVDSRDLIIVFSSCTRKGIRARYNYVRTLKEVPCNKLFLLDDFASDHRGSFYLGSNMKFEEAVVVRELIDRVREPDRSKTPDLLRFQQGRLHGTEFRTGLSRKLYGGGWPPVFSGTKPAGHREY